MGKIVSPIVTGALFFLVFTPFAMVLRWMGKDPLGLSIGQGRRDILDSTERLRSTSRYDQSILESYPCHFLASFWQFLRVRKKFWLLPLILMALLFGVLLILAESSALAPFIYTLF